MNGPETDRRQVLLIGVGNEFRTDDGLGIFVAREVRRRKIEGVEVLEHTGEGGSLIEAWKGSQALVIVDAVSSGAQPGIIHRFDLAQGPLPARILAYSSHAFGVCNAIELARHLGTLPAVALLYGLEGERFDNGVGLSDSVVRSVPELLSILENDVHSLTTPCTK